MAVRAVRGQGRDPSRMAGGRAVKDSENIRKPQRRLAMKSRGRCLLGNFPTTMHSFPLALTS